MKDNITLPRKNMLKHTATVKEIAALSQVSHQRVLQMIKAKKWEEKGIAKKIGHQWMLLPETADMIKRVKGKRGNPNMIKGKPSLYADKIRETWRKKRESQRKLGTHHREQPDNLPTKKKKKRSVIENHDIDINKQVKKHIEQKGEVSIFLDEKE